MIPLATPSRKTDPPESYPGLTAYRKARGRIDRDADRLGLPAGHIEPYPEFGAPRLLVADFSKPEGIYFGRELWNLRQKVARLAERLNTRSWCRKAIPSDDRLKVAVLLAGGAA